MRLNGFDLTKNRDNVCWTLTNTSNEFLLYAHLDPDGEIWCAVLAADDRDNLITPPLVYVEFTKNYRGRNFEDSVACSITTAKKFVNEMELCG